MVRERLRGNQVMPDKDTINYGRYMEKAMRGVMVEVLGHVAEHGLPGAHYFYITFETEHPGVDIADWLRERYPNEMMIVLQEWFDDLAVTGDRFTVTLNFSNQPATLVIPFDAVKTFIDPSAKFGLKFDDHESDEMVLDLDDIEGAETPDDGAPADEPPTGTNGGKTHPSADVVSLDRFRKT
jgi:hypothetical protein